MDDYSKILKSAFNNFILQVEGKQVPIPYRINIPPVEHPRRQGKSSPEDLLDQLYLDASQQKFDLKEASVANIQQFMQKNLLGLDCSGFVYRMLNYLLDGLGKGSLEGLGLPHVGRTNVRLLTLEKFAILFTEISQIRSGDVIRLNSNQKIPHAVIVLENSDGSITYAHSGNTSKLNGVHSAVIKISDSSKGLKEQDWLEQTTDNKPYSIFFNPDKGDGVFRLKNL